MAEWQVGDRVRIIRKHPWKGATGTVVRPYSTSRHDLELKLDEPWGVLAYDRRSCVSRADIEPEYKPAEDALFELGEAQR